MNFLSRWILLGTAVVNLLPAIGRGAEQLPNVVIIFADDLGYGDVGIFGAKGYKTPNLDRMAAQGRRFTSFYVAQPVCSASRAALLTGNYPNRIGIHGALGPNAKHGLNANEMTLAELVKQKGYATGAFGKWHLGHHPQFLPTRHGFDEYFGIPYSNDMWPFHPEARPGTYPALPLIEGERTIELNPDQTQLTTRLTERAVDFIRRKKDNPFFLYLAHPMPHVPLFVSDKYEGKTERGLFGDVISEIDWSVGEVLKALKSAGVEQNTLVIFTSDNGPWLSYGDHAGSTAGLREGKGTVWEGGVRVPFVARWPGKIPAGTTCEEPVMTIDILPTVAKLIEGKLPEHKIDGRNIWPLLAGESGAKSPHEALFFYYHANQLQAVRSGDWKLYAPHQYRTLAGRPGGTNGIPAKYEQRSTEWELYNLARDRNEEKNVAAEFPAKVKELKGLLDSAREDMGDALTKRAGRNNREPGRLD